jgi:hypothetical protein
MEQEKTTRPFPLRFGLPGGIKQLRVEKIHAIDIDAEEGHWRLWLMANSTFTLGTFIQLLDNGDVNRVTWHEDGTESVLNLKGE